MILVITVHKALNRHVAVFLWFAPLLFLWQALIRQVSIEWSVNPQYAFGWAVPLLCLYLLARKLRRIGLPSTTQFHGTKFPLSGPMLTGTLLALCYCPTRLIQEANPEWRLISWALALETVGLTMCVLSTLFPLRWTLNWKHSLLFPIVFFLVAVPWPTSIERPIITAMTAIVASGSTELLNVLGTPSVLHGHIVEVGSGAVGINEACSGIRSFEATLMLALFFGEVYELVLPRRALLVLMGLVLSVLFNLIRGTLLAWIAANSGLKEMNTWHDPASTLVPALCFGAIWLLACWLRRHTRDWSAKTGRAHFWEYVTQCSAGRANRIAFPLILLLWFVGVELATEMWYQVHEQRLPAASTWRVELPRDQPGFRELPLVPDNRQFLRFDEGLNATWCIDGGLRCQAIFLRWNPGKVSALLARNHTPADCLRAAGLEVASETVLDSVSVRGLELSFRSYITQSEVGPLYLFYCLWQDHGARTTTNSEKLSYRNRLAAAMAGKRNSGQRSLELAFWGAENETIAQHALQSVLEQIVVAN